MFNQLTVKIRLIILLAVTSSALLITAILGHNGITGMKDEIDHVYLGGVDEVKYLNIISNNLSWNVLENLQKVSTGQMNGADALAKIQDDYDQAIKAWGDYQKNVWYLKEDLENKWDQKKNQFEELLKKNNSFILDVQDFVKKGESKKIDELVINQFQTVFVPLVASIQEMIQYHIDDSAYDYTEAIKKMNFYGYLLAVCSIFFLCLSFWVAYSIIRSIVKPLQYLVENVNRVSQGDVTMEMQSKEGGEFGKLFESIQNMIDSTKKISLIITKYASYDLSEKMNARSDKDSLGISLNEMSSRMRAMVGDIKEEVNVLSTSSQEILSSITQLSSGSAESAAAVTETTTTLEELKQTAHVSSEKAKDVLRDAEETLSTVKASEKSVASVIDGMNQIQQRMNIISECIFKLSEKSSAIAEIMDSVNDIAEQSNLLAVNAAIEAAKAGEQGRSFSVVAGEIRALAEQSKGATMQVKALLNDIQTATNSAVLATEQGSKAVLSGMEQSNKTTESIKILSANMMRVTQSANQIVLSNQQQLVGTEQISIAMTNINESTQQHVDRLKEIEFSVSALSKVGGSLKALTDQYKLTTESTSGERLPHLIDKIQSSIPEKHVTRK